MNFKNIIAVAALASAVALTSCGSSDKNDSREAAASTDTHETETPAAPAETQKWMPDSVTMMPSGLGIFIENPGDDKRADANTPVTLHYRGYLPDGTVFDSSYDRGEPATFMAGQVIPGFAEGIMQVGEGGKATLYIPSQLGYGPAGAGNLIAPNQNLIFDIEVISIGK